MSPLTTGMGLLPLGPPGTEYVRETLRRGRTLSRELLSTMPLEAGEVRAILPHGVELTDAVDSLNEGGIAASDIATRFLAEFVSGYLEEDANAWSVFEHAFATPEDSWLARSTLDYFALRDEVYLIVPRGKHSISSVERTIKRAGRYPLIGVLAKPPVSFAVLRRRAVDDLVLQTLAVATTAIIVGAFDEESYVIWSRAN